MRVGDVMRVISELRVLRQQEFQILRDIRQVMAEQVCPDVDIRYHSVATLVACCAQLARKTVGGIAQLVEHRPFKPLVPGSSPGAPTILDP